MKEVVKGLDWLAKLLEAKGEDVSGMKLPSLADEDVLPAARREALGVRRRYFYRASSLSSVSWVHVDRLLDPQSEARIYEEQTRSYELLRRQIAQEMELARRA
jgi:hypothetical protein